MKGSQNIYLIGMMGSGKSTVGQILARKLVWDYIDLDAEIETSTGISISDIFDQEGEAHFRDMERKALKSAAEKKKRVIATGGGIILDEKNRRLMRETGTIVFLDADMDTLALRLKKSNDRPLLGSGNRESSLKSLWNGRAALYRSTAHFRVDASVEATVCAENILTELKIGTSQSSVGE